MKLCLGPFGTVSFFAGFLVLGLISSPAWLVVLGLVALRNSRVLAYNYRRYRRRRKRKY